MLLAQEQEVLDRLERMAEIEEDEKTQGCDYR